MEPQLLKERGYGRSRPPQDIEICLGAVPDTIINWHPINGGIVINAKLGEEILDIDNNMTFWE
jgi:hypothetical protein